MSGCQVRSLITRCWSSSCSSHVFQVTSGMSALVRGRVSTRTALEPNSVLPSCVILRNTTAPQLMIFRRRTIPLSALFLTSTLPVEQHVVAINQQHLGLTWITPQPSLQTTGHSNNSIVGLDWSAGLDHTGPEEASAVRTETE